MIPPRNYEKRSRDGRLRSPKHRAFIRSRLCILFDRGGCEGKVECCHARSVSPEIGMGMRPSDIWCFGACRKHHRESESREIEFGKEHGLDLRLICLEYAAQSPDHAVKKYLYENGLTKVKA